MAKKDDKKSDEAAKEFRGLTVRTVEGFSKLSAAMKEQQKANAEEGKENRLSILAPLDIMAKSAAAGIKNAAKSIEEKRENFRMQESLLNGINSIEKGIVGLGATFGKAIKEKASKFGGGLKNMLGKLLIGGALAAFVAFMNSPYWEKFKTLLQDTIAPALVGIYNNVLKPIWDVGLSLIFRQFEAIGVLFEDIGLAITDFKNGDILGGISKLIGGLGTFFLTTVDNLITSVYNLFGGLFGLSPTDSIFGSISDFISDTWTSIKTFFTDLYNGVLGIFTDPVGTLNTMWTALTGEGGLVDILFSPIDKVIETVTGWFGITMPEDWSLTKIVTDALDTVFAWIGTAFIDPKEALTQLWNGLVGEGGLVDFIFKPVDEAIAAITGWFGITLPESWSLTDFIKDTFGKAKDFFVGIFTWGAENSTDEEGNFSLKTLISNALTKIGDFFRSLLDIDVRGLASSVMPQAVVDFLFGKKVDQDSAEFKAMTPLEQAEAMGIYDKDLIGNSEVNEGLLKNASDAQLQAILDDDDISSEMAAKIRALQASRSGAGEFSGSGQFEEKKLNAYEKKLQRIENKRGDRLNRSSTEAQEEKAQAKQNIAIISQQQKMHPREMAMMNRGGGQVAVPVPIKDSSSAATAATSSGF